MNNIENYILTSIDDNYELLLEDTANTNRLLLNNDIDDIDIRQRIYTRRDEIIEERKQIITEFTEENKNDYIDITDNNKIFSHPIFRKIYQHFPQLQSRIYLENAGGTLHPICIFEKLGETLGSICQPYGMTNSSIKITKLIDKSKIFINKLINNKDGDIIFSSSASQIAYNISNSLTFNHNDEIILCNFSHESCITCFEKIKNVNIRFWNIRKDTNIVYEDLYTLINKDTKLVVIPHVSNILGSIIDIKTIIMNIKNINPNTKVYVDGVAYLPHRNIDVYNYNVDFYVFSFYKFMGFRISVLYIKNGILQDLNNINHYFLENEDKLQIGGIQYEMLSSILGIKEYLKNILNTTYNLSKSKISNCYLYFIKHETLLTQYFDYNFNELSINNIPIINLNDKSSILDIEYNIYNKKSLDIKILTDYSKTRLPIFSIYSDTIKLYKVSMFLSLLGIECKVGKFYCNRLLEYFNIEEVLRVSCFHYNLKKDLRLFFTRLLEFTPNSNIKDFEYKNVFVQFTENIISSFNDLPLDKYYDNIRYRSFSLIDCNNWMKIGNSVYYQDSNYNNYLGNKIREYSHISDDVLNDESFKDMINEFILTINTFEKMYTFLYVHQIRVECNENNVNPIPEGIHKDGYEFIGIYCVSRENIEGGVTQLYDNNMNEILTTILESNQGIILNDTKYYHSITPIFSNYTNTDSSKDISNTTYRDIFVITTVS